MNYYNQIKELIENNLIEIKKTEISNSYHTLMTYYNVGKILVDAQGGEKRAKYGNELIKNYSIKLIEEYGKKYSYRNLWSMRKFYQSFPKVNTVCSQLNWSHYRYIISIDNESKRNYYINSTIEHNLSVRQLVDYIKGNAFERLVNKEYIP